ncbi:MAG: EAL domain-containing protein [Alphaproteobacteria bacterium]|nr:EAL domain-containing protein [Alphaproteobacteria bacterium]
MSVSIADNGVDELQVSALRGERDRLLAFAFCGSDFLVELDASLNVSFVRGMTAVFTGHSSESLMGQSFNDLVQDSDRVRISALLKRAISGARIEMHNMRLLGPEGPSPLLSMTGYFLPDLKGRYFLGFRLGAAPSAIAARDGVARDTESGLLDAETFAMLCELKLNEAHEEGRQYQVTLFDIRGLKKFSRRLDLYQRNELMTKLGESLQCHSLGCDSAGRFGVERYGLIHEAELDIQALRGELAGLAAHEGSGAGRFDIHVATMDLAQEGLSPADSARALGFMIYHFRSQQEEEVSDKILKAHLDSVIEDTAQRITGVRNVVSDQAFDIAFQPIVDLKTRSIHHYESLTRIIKDGVHTSPFEFIRFAEEVGVVSDFDLAMCRRVVEWLMENRRLGKEYSVAVNLSGKSIASSEFVTQLLELLRNHKEISDRLLFELTESASIDNLESVNNVIQSPRQEGHRFCLDDFGAGEMAFHYLRAIDVDIVKIDGSYVREALDSKKDKHFLKAISGLSSDLGIETVAEMIEDEQTVDLLDKCGIQFGQGYLFGKPSFDISSFEALYEEEESEDTQQSQTAVGS